MRAEERVINKIRELMKKEGISQGELADRVGVSRATINNYLTGSTPMLVCRVEQIAEALGVTVVDLVADDTDTEALDIGRQITADADIADLVRACKIAPPGRIRRIIQLLVD